MTGQAVVLEDELEVDPLVGRAVQRVLLGLGEEELHGVVVVDVLGRAGVVAGP